MRDYPKTAAEKIPLNLSVFHLLFFSSPQSGLVSSTFFEMRCNNWVTSDSSDNPILYKFRYEVKLTKLAEINTLPTEAEASQLWYYGDRSTSSSRLPLGDKDNDFKLGLSVLICNKYDCCAQVHLNARVK